MIITERKWPPMLTMIVGVVLIGAGAVLGAWGAALFKAGWEARAAPPTTPVEGTAEPLPKKETDADILAREQLADLRERRAVEGKERDRLAADVAERKREAARLAYTNSAIATVDRLRQEYVLSHDGLSAGMIAGTEALPEDWVNGRLKAMKMPWAYKIVDGGGTTLSPTPGNPYYKQ